MAFEEARLQNRMSEGLSRKSIQRLNNIHIQIIRQKEQADLEPCVYCGAPANSIDHVPPRRARDQIIAVGLALQYEFFTVHACRECNSTLSDKDLWTVGARRTYIKKRLRSRYADILRIPDWDDGELGTLSPALRGFVLQGMMVREHILDRIAYPNTRKRT